MTDEREVGGALVEAGGGRRKRGAYQVGPRLRVAIEAMATGRAKTITEAAELAQLTREAVSKALRKESVRGYLRETIMETLGVGATRAARRMLELVEAENSMTGYHASKFLLAVGANVIPPSPPATQVNIGITAERAGFVLDLREPNDRNDRAVVRPVASGPVIEHEAVELDDMK